MRYSNKIIRYHLDVAKIQASMSHAIRLKVGSVILRDDRIVSTGRNGCVSGGSNVCEYKEGGQLITKQEVIHAEANAILWAARSGVPLDGCSIVTTHQPCMECAKMIIQSGINEVYYQEKYRDDTGLLFLESNNIKVMKV